MGEGLKYKAFRNVASGAITYRDTASSVLNLCKVEEEAYLRSVCCPIGDDSLGEGLKLCKAFGNIASEVIIHRGTVSGALKLCKAGRRAHL